MNDISIEQINLLLKEKENKIGVMESTTKSSREKLKKINTKLKTQEKELLNILSMIQHEEVNLLDIDNIQNPTIDEIYSKIEKLQDAMRKIRISLVNLIRNE